MQRFPLLNYQLSQLRTNEPSLYRCIGAIEAVSDEGLLWVRSEAVTVAVSMNRAQIFLVPPEDSEDGALQRLRWSQVPLVLEDSKVYIAGPYCTQGNRSFFCSTKEAPLMVLLFEGNEQYMVYRVLAAARSHNEYWNGITLYSLALGVFSQLLIAAFYSARPALRVSVLVALTAVCIPILPLLPPGVLLTSFYRRWWRRARQYRSHRDVLEFMEQDRNSGEDILVKNKGRVGWNIGHYTNRSRQLLAYAIFAAGFGIVINMLLFFFMLQSLFL